MRFTKNVKNCFSALLLFSIMNALGQSTSNKFTIVLDAGHGGKDPGNSYHGYVEKDIALKTTLKVGKFLESEKDFQVIYTRKTDEFIELVERPKIANKINANLFVSIHCNSVKNFEPEGTETFVMALKRSEMNLEVTKKENSVIYLEDDYKKKYKGFDPNNPIVAITGKMLQEENLNSSISLATTIQENFTTKLGRHTRGVKQQPLWVLDAASMPGVLIELGFLSNEEEGEYLNSDEGQSEMARQIANAIIHYKKANFDEAFAGEEIAKPEPKPVKTEIKDSSTAKIVKPLEPVKPIETAKEDSKDGYYKIQLFASSKKKDLASADFKGLKDISFTFENNLYRYYYGKTFDINDTKQLYNEAKKHGFPDAFVVQFNDGKATAVK